MHVRFVPIPSRPASPTSPRWQEVIAPLHDAAEPESATPQAYPLGPEGGDKDKRQQARAGGEKSDWWSRRMAADELAAAARDDESGDGVGGGDLERGGAVVELVVQDLGVCAGDLEVAQGVGVQAVYAGWAGCGLACRRGARSAGLHLDAGNGKDKKETHSHRPC